MNITIQPICINDQRVPIFVTNLMVRSILLYRRYFGLGNKSAGTYS